MKSTGRVGRPKGHKLSIETKKKISKSKLGQKHTKETKRKISNAVRRESVPAVSIERIMETDLNKAYTSITNGYTNVYIPSNGVSPGKSMRFHVALMEQTIGRKLLSGEQVHHWGDKLNNNIKLLTLCKNKVQHNIFDKVKENLMKYLKNN